MTEDDDFSNEALEKEQENIRKYQAEYGMLESLSFDQAHRDAIGFQLKNLVEQARLQEKRSDETSRVCAEVGCAGNICRLAKKLHETDMELLNMLKAIPRHKIKYVESY